MTGEEILWRAVLGQAVRDIYDVSARVREETLAWLQSTDFETVCDYACVDAENMRDQLISLASLPPAMARKYGSQLRIEILGE